MDIGVPTCMSELLRLCWLDNPDERPTMSEIYAYLEN